MKYFLFLAIVFSTYIGIGQSISDTSNHHLSIYTGATAGTFTLFNDIDRDTVVYDTVKVIVLEYWLPHWQIYYPYCYDTITLKRYMLDTLDPWERPWEDRVTIRAVTGWDVLKKVSPYYDSNRGYLIFESQEHIKFLARNKRDEIKRVLPGQNWRVDW